MKKVRPLLITAAIAITVMLCCSINAFALTDGDWEFQLLDNEATITKYLGSDTEIVVPDTIYGVPVTEMSTYNVFDGTIEDEITSIAFPKTLKTVPVVRECGKLETVILPEGIEGINQFAFMGSSSLKNIKLPESLKTIGWRAFENCTSLKSINFPAGLESIGKEVFKGSGLETVDMSMTSLGLTDELFQNCKNLKSVKLSPTLKEIPRYAFGYCESLEYIDIPASVTFIGSFAFTGCKSLENIVLPTSLEKMYEFAMFSGCTSLKEVVIPYGTKFIGGHAFENCTNLKAVYIPDTVTSIGILNIIENCPNAIVYCGDGSKTAEHCKKMSISYLTDSSVNSGIHVYYNGERISFHSYGQNPELLEGRTLVPLRSIFEAMGADVDWDDATSTAIAKRDGVTVTIQIGASEIYKNGKAISLDVPAQLMNGRTMVPARAIVEAFGADVEWNGNGRIVFITENR